MLFAYDYPLLGAFWTMFVFFIWILWFMLLFRIIADIFRSHDLSGWGKGAWLIFVVLAPFLGVFVYVIARGKAMSQHAIDDANARDQAMSAYVRDAVVPSGTADEIVKLAGLKDSGLLTEAEFAQQKAKLLA